MAAKTDRNGSTFGYTYDEIGQLKKEHHRYSYLANNQVKSITYPTLTDGSILNTAYTYNKELGWTESMTNTKGSFVLSGYSYSYDNKGNRVAVSESRNNGGTQTTSYTYDALNRLVSITRPDGGKYDVYQ
ncbi:RHS repeat domain-containing protein [Paenibacillus sp. P46E]|uniref:RHS repeat domain-containing protein n=1 Tax=Paenibacillus sp. P46E TaxID=1349436 RepID=UPI000966944B|nr:RHS repeat domain-containing protein [Paenibacillus sp. P46E]OKP94997.1 hypothetical protein A3849_28415 [Paenibacillus sp. P46E]